MTWVAYVDESLPKPYGGPASYVLAAVVVEADVSEQLRRTAQLMHVSGPRFHWRFEATAAKKRAIDLVASQPALHVVVVGTPIASDKKAERARRLCLERLLFELETSGVGQVFFEARTEVLNRRDLQVINAFRARGAIGQQLHVAHAYPQGEQAEPLLWIADAVCGAVGADFKGDPKYLATIAQLITWHRLDLA